MSERFPNCRLSHCVVLDEEGAPTYEEMSLVVRVITVAVMYQSIILRGRSVHLVS